MPHYLSDAELERTAPAEIAAFRGPIPTQIVSNGEYNPLPQTPEQRRVEARVSQLAADLAPKHGLSRRKFLATSAGMAAAFIAMNDVFGPVWEVSRAEAATPGVADMRAQALSGQFIVDAQTHFVRDDFNQAGLLDLAKYAKQNWNPVLWGENNLARYKFENYVKEIFVDSDTKVALLSGAPFDDPSWDLLTNDQIAAARHSINKFAGSRRLLGHAVFTPKKDGWMDVVDRAISTLKPDSWKGYTIGDPLFPSKLESYWWLDDEKLVYPFYEKAVKSNITTICIHKGLLPADYETSWPKVWEYATVWDVGKAAKDWPKLNFIMYHGALRPFLEKPDAALAEFEQTGRIKWATDLAEIPAKFGVKNVYGEVGTAFATAAVANPRFAAAFIGTLSQGARRRPRHLGHGLTLVRLAPVADRGDAAARDPRGHAEEARLQAARAGGRPGEEGDLQRQHGAALQPEAEDRPARDHHGQDRRDQGGVPGRRRRADERAVWVRGALVAGVKGSCC